MMPGTSKGLNTQSSNPQLPRRRCSASSLRDITTEITHELLPRFRPTVRCKSPTSCLSVLHCLKSLQYNGACRGSSCSYGGTTLEEAQSWIENYKKPNTVAPILVDIGPGKFGGFSCLNIGDISLRGSGRDKTTLGSPQSAALNANNCTNLHVQDLKITGGFPAPVYWLGNGNSTWVNVLLDGAIYGWTESNCSFTTSKPVHRWFSSTIKSAGKVAYAAQCSENWFYGSEFITSGQGFGNGIRGITARGVSASDMPEVHVYGSVIRVLPDMGVSFPTASLGGGDGEGVLAVLAGKNAIIHIHGTGIDVMGNNMPNNVAALVVANGGMIHAAQSSFMLQTGSGGIAYRIKNEGGMARAPYLWENQILDPMNPLNLQSDNGADMTVENTCVDTACSSMQPHLLLFSTACVVKGPWFDSVTGRCRGQ